MVVGEIAEAVDLLVIGGGPGGYAAALHAARLGRRVTLVERGELGGTCLNVGCIPSKALIEVAEAMVAPDRVAAWGVTTTASLDMSAVQAHLRSVVDKLTGGVRHLLDAAGVVVLAGEARFVKPNRVVVEHGASVEHLDFRHAIVATGSRPVDLVDIPPDGTRVVGSADLLSTESLPEELVLVGGGYVGVELGCAFAKLGSRVTIVEAETSILPGFDDRITRTVTRGLRNLGVGICCSSTAVGIEEAGLVISGPDGSVVLPADRVAVVVGRRPNSDLIGLVEVGATVDDRGLVVVDSGRRATESVFAIGDLTAGPALAHKATAEAEVAADVACGRANAFDPTCIPLIVFSDPQVMVVGMTEADASGSGIAATSYRFPLAASGRAATLGMTDGFVTVVADGDGTVIGVQAVGAHVAELAGEAALAVETAATVEDMAGTIHAHPTLGEAIAEAAMGLAGRPLHAG
ncbi:MAG: dihydrolipoyl dehydrogenase [Actinobacteria bacterium]|jgi:dihydrolipoamide dehydrogenase|nr:dihydrolipoyl dehydrogenase [Actinomycetota bacterium]MBT3686470.1 dihydrolipoyl dehydrogenase [Actinomycetota bacterium]MBT4037827.1 dihydrolipoyl dehydrogenase [Actinomycetota bacterium]MBT4278029.1 dihydrolipoyl dehydrogenase [Actinomycetota bacterium]MBT4343290.1 dihydrolipoyl dehydrogenase [Actinomycetota bacterium]